MIDYESFKRTYDELRDLALRHSIPVICATQVTRPPGSSVPVIGQQDIIFIDYPSVLR